MAVWHYLQLSLTPGIGPILIGRAVALAGSAQAACEMPAEQWRSVEGIGAAKGRQITAALAEAGAAAQKELGKAKELGINLLCPEDGDYPTLLRTIPDPPPVLYVRGKLEPRDLHAVAIVGSRRCTYYGREQAERFSALLAGVGITVISGGARGVDSAAHRGALVPAEGRTIAVLGSGIDVPYPPENASLFETIAMRGAVVSEFPLGTPPNRENFPRRNRVVSGMSRGVLVVEADEGSGALITARQANEDHNRTVFALPGRVDNPMSWGPHQLIRDGAVLVSSLGDILDALGPLPEEAAQPTLIDKAEAQSAEGEESVPWTERPAMSPRSAVHLSERQQLILTHLGESSASVDELIDRTALPAQTVLQELTFLSLKAVVKRIDGQTFARRGSAS